MKLKDNASLLSNRRKSVKCEKSKNVACVSKNRPVSELKGRLLRGLGLRRRGRKGLKLKI